MGFIRYASLLFGVFLFIDVGIVFSNTTNISEDPSYAEGPFLFWCNPYIRSFEENKHYQPLTGPCKYSVPNTLTGNIIIGLYRGDIGNATFVAGDSIIGTPTLVQENVNTFSNMVQDEPLFAVIYDGTLNQGTPTLDAYLRTGSPLPAGAIENQNYYIRSWYWGSKPSNELDPVIIVPGILSSWEKNGEWVLDPITHTYSNLINTLLANGYVENETLFKFPYDWRNTNVITARLLEEKIDQIKETCDCLQVDIVAHSMGGIVSSQYLLNDNPHSVDQIIFLGTPFAGAPNTYVTWESGEVTFGAPIENLIMQRIFEREARDRGFTSVYEYIRSGLVASVQELLPIYSYLQTNTSVPLYPDQHPQNQFLEDITYRLGNISHTFRPYGVVGNVGVESTTGRYIVLPSTQLPKWEYGEPVTVERVEGDGVVPHDSSLFMFGPDKEFPNVDHTQLASSSAAYIFEMFNNRPPEILVGDLFSELHTDYSILIQKLAPSYGDFRIFAETVREIITYYHPLISKVLVVVLYSPIDVEITAPDGTRIGTDLSTGSIVNNISGAIYSDPTSEHEYIIIPNPLPGEYKVSTKGTGVGSYTIATGYADPATTSVSLVSGTTTLNQIIENTLTLSPTTTAVHIEEEVASSTPPTTHITPDTCVADMQEAYKNKWITKRQVYSALLADCKLLGVLFVTRDKAKTHFIRKGVMITIRLTLDHMDKLAKDKSNKPEAVALITKNTTWFRENEL